MDIHIYNDISQITIVQDALREWVGGDIDIETKRKIHIATDEVLSNIIQYAFTDQNEHRIGVHAQKQDDRIKIQFIDDGLHFDPVEYLKKPMDKKTDMNSKNGGVGILLVQKLMDTFEYHREGNYNYLTIQINKNKPYEN